MHSEDSAGQAERYMLWQSLVGAWPLDLQIDDAYALARFATRVNQWQTKSLREAKLNSSWFRPDLSYEAAAAQYVYELLGWPAHAARNLAQTTSGQAAADIDCHDPGAGLLRSFHGFVQQIAPVGAVNSLAQVVLRLTVPGVPDLYQGTEWWDMSFVDPDNRQAVDYDRRRHALGLTEPGTDLKALLSNWPNGHVKQAVIRSLLALRAKTPGLFGQAAYTPLQTNGRRESHLIAFSRHHGKAAVVVVVPRICARALGPDAALKMDMTYWGDTSIMVPVLRSQNLRHLFTGGVHPCSEAGLLPARSLFAGFPCAVLTNI